MILTDPAEARRRVEHMRELYAAEGMVFSAHLDLTYRCDLDCAQCYLDDKERWPEMKTADWLSALDQLARMQTLMLQWSGGEVFVRPDFPELLEHAAGLGFMSLVKTHGGNLDAERARAMASLRVERIDFSVYSLHDAVHDAVTRVPGSLGATLRGIDHALAAGLAVQISCNVFGSNLDEMEELAEHFYGLGVHKVAFDANIMPDHCGVEVPGELLLDAEGYKRALRTARRVKDAHGEPYGGRARLDPEAHSCGAGNSALYISPDGAVWPCVMFPFEVGHLRRERLAEIWERSPGLCELRAFRNGDRAACMSCGGGGDCFFCMGDAFKRTGDYRKAPAVFDERNRAHMEIINELRPGTFSAADLDSVPRAPDAPIPAGRERKFVFPIYRPSRGGGRAPGGSDA